MRQTKRHIFGSHARMALLCASWACLVGCGSHRANRASIAPQPMPATGSFTGVYFSPQYGRMDIAQNGQTVVGEYTRDERRGQIQGLAVGNVLRFTWTEKRELVVGRPTISTGKGYFRYIIDRDGNHKLLGEWGHDQSEVGGGPWNAVKSKKLAPKLLGSHGEGDEEATENVPMGGEDSSSSDDEGLGDL